MTQSDTGDSAAGLPAQAAAGGDQRLRRLRALDRLTEMAERGDFAEFVGDKAAYRKRP